MQRVIIRTGDGSASVYMPELDEHYHSKFGAIRESQHVFIEAGLAEAARRSSDIAILEVGFGTGLNAFLTWHYALEHALTVRYYAVEPYPLDPELVAELNYPQWLGSGETQTVFTQLHKAPWKEAALQLPHFILHKYPCTIQELPLSEPVDLVYFDAFAPRVQPELWSVEVFHQLYSMMKPGAILVTYCAKGEVKRNMRVAGFTLEALPGPPGKREMTRALKPVI